MNPLKRAQTLLSVANRLMFGTLLLGLFASAVRGDDFAPLAAAVATQAPRDPLAWPTPTRDCRPGAYWWWMGSAVDRTNLLRELKCFHEAGLGTVHIIPIYGAKGWEAHYVPYLSQHWMDLLRYTVTQANRLGLNVDMSTGTGWCFGGPHVTAADANALAVVKTFTVRAGAKLTATFDPQKTQALVAYSPTGQCIELTDRIAPDGTVHWSAPDGSWRVYAVSQRFSGQRVKRAAPGGQGPMLNLIYPSAMRHYLEWFQAAFAHYTGPKPHAFYHDSYEYRSDWAPDFFAQFAQRRGYRLQTELPALFGHEDTDRAERVKADYRETVSELIGSSLRLWVQWCHAHGFLTRNQAHGSPGNLLDLYAVADIPETEMFHLDRNKLVSKFASSAAHVTGKPLVASETGTWLKEHFTVRLADLKYLFDDLFLSGINHLFYHGTCYSPAGVPWPGWVFYASTEMNPRNSIWHDVPALNAYAARCQAVLQCGKPDNDILLYWPIADYWHDAPGLLPQLTVHARAWLTNQPIGKAAAQLWGRGYAFDYVSDHQLGTAHAENGGVQMPGGRYRVIVVPVCHFMPVATLAKLLTLAHTGATVIFEQHLPTDVPGWGHLAERRAQFKKLLTGVRFTPMTDEAVQRASLGTGCVLVGDLEAALVAAGVPREPMFDHAGLMCLRRVVPGGHYYFITDRGKERVNGWIKLGTTAKSVVVMDPLTGRTGVGALRIGPHGVAEVYLQLSPGGSVIWRTFTNRTMTGRPWAYDQTNGPPVKLTGRWQVQFLEGGPVLPASFHTQRLASWTELGGPNAQRFAGTARYTLTFNAPADRVNRRWFLDLGQVCQSARVRLNGYDLGTLLIPPFRVVVDHLRPTGNVLEVEVTNLAANRIRDLDRRGVHWQNFHDINFVNIDYRHFNAANWSLHDSGLLGPVTLTPIMTQQLPP